MIELKDHRLVTEPRYDAIIYEKRPVLDPIGQPVPDLFNAWIWLTTPAQLNSYTTGALYEVTGGRPML